MTRREVLQTSALGSFAAPLFAKKKPKPDKNVLFIAVDDLRPDLGCYGHPDVISPNINRLAGRGLTFLNNYCQQAVCSPSRTSLMTGLRPDTTGVHDLSTHFRRNRPNAVTLPQQFKEHGYTTTAFGKIFHKPQLDDQPSWSIPPWIVENEEWGSEANRAFTQRKWEELRANGWVSDENFYFHPEKRKPRDERRGWGLESWGAPDVADNELSDGKTADAAIAAMGELKSQRFFLAVGLTKPHLPFVAPKKYYDLYPRAYIKPDEHPQAPRDAPYYALHQSEELRGYTDIPAEGPIPDELARDLKRAYYASISYADAQIGRLLKALEDSGLWENTAIVLWGDHGYHLGEHGLWNKHTNFENATRAPLIMRYPGQRNAGRKSRALTELVDVCPSLCDICNVPLPGELEGSTLTPLFQNPDQLWKRAVFSQYPREIPGVGPGMGYSMRTKRYRYTEWAAMDSPYKSRELYDYRVDPFESRNIATKPENVSLVNGMAGMLQEGWRGALPPIDPRSGSSS